MKLNQPPPIDNYNYAIVICITAVKVKGKKLTGCNYKKEHLYHTKQQLQLYFFYRKFFMSDATSAKHSAPFFIRNSLLLNPHKTEMHRTFAALAVAMSTSESPT